MLKHKFCLVFAFFLMFSIVSAVEVKLVNVEDLKEGDVIIDKYGNEITIDSISTKPSESLTISEYLQQKLDSVSLSVDFLDDKARVGSGSAGVGSITGNAIVSGELEDNELNNFQKLLNKFKAWLSR